MEKITVPISFIQKLKDKGAYEKFLINTENYAIIHNKYSPLNLHLFEKSFLEYVAHAFVWEATNEGFAYWNKIAHGIDEEN